MIKVYRTSILTLKDLEEATSLAVKVGHKTVIVQVNDSESAHSTYDVYVTNMRLQGGQLKAGTEEA